MQELTKKLLEVGVIPAQSIALLKKWQALPDDMPEDVKLAQTQEEVLKIVDEMAVMLEKEDEMPELRETDLDIGYALKEENTVAASIDVNAGLHQNLNCKCRLGETRDHKLVYMISNPARDAVFARRGNIVTLPWGKCMITGVEPRYQDKELKYYILEVEQTDA